MSEIVSSEAAMSAIFSNKSTIVLVCSSPISMENIVSSNIALSVVFSDNNTIELVIENPISMEIIASSDNAMSYISNNNFVMTKIEASSMANTKLNNSPLAVSKNFSISKTQTIIIPSKLYLINIRSTTTYDYPCYFGYTSLTNAQFSYTHLQLYNTVVIDKFMNKLQCHHTLNYPDTLVIKYIPIN